MCFGKFRYLVPPMKGRRTETMHQNNWRSCGSVRNIIYLISLAICANACLRSGRQDFSLPLASLGTSFDEIPSSSLVSKPDGRGVKLHEFQPFSLNFNRCRPRTSAVNSSRIPQSSSSDAPFVASDAPLVAHRTRERSCRKGGRTVFPGCEWDFCGSLLDAEEKNAGEKNAPAFPNEPTAHATASTLCRAHAMMRLHSRNRIRPHDPNKSLRYLYYTGSSAYFGRRNSQVCGFPRYTL